MNGRVWQSHFLMLGLMSKFNKKFNTVKLGFDRRTRNHYSKQRFRIFIIGNFQNEEYELGGCVFLTHDRISDVFHCKYLLGARAQAQEIYSLKMA
jgi:hypothetical protein